MSQHNYINPAFCQNSELNTLLSVASDQRISLSEVESFGNSNYKLNLNKSALHNSECSVQESFPNSYFPSRSNRVKPKFTYLQYSPFQSSAKQENSSHHNILLDCNKNYSAKRNDDAHESFSELECYSLLPIKEVFEGSQNSYTLVPEEKPYDRSQDQHDTFDTRKRGDEELCRLHVDPQITSVATNKFSRLYPICKEISQNITVDSSKLQSSQSKTTHEFSNDFGSKYLLIVDKSSNQRYHIIPTAEDEELVDDNQEIIQLQNGRVHRYAIIPTDDAQQDNMGVNQEETCLTTANDKESQYLPCFTCELTEPSLTSTRRRSASMATQLYPNTSIKKLAATKRLHEVLSKPRQFTAQNTESKSHYIVRNENHQVNLERESTQPLYDADLQCRNFFSPHRLHYEVTKPLSVERNIISPRVAGTKACSELTDGVRIKENSARVSPYPHNVANATITLAVVSLMLVLGSTMNSGIIVYIIACLGKSFYLQYSLVAAFSGLGLGFLGFRARKAERMPNRSFISGYILVTLFCLLKCCSLLIIIVLNPYPGFPLHDVISGVIIGLSTFTLFFIALGVIGSLWCNRPPPDNRVNVI